MNTIKNIFEPSTSSDPVQRAMDAFSAVRQFQQDWKDFGSDRVHRYFDNVDGNWIEEFNKDPAMSINALVNPKILVWAREINGLQIELVAKKINKESKELIEWESGKSNPTIEDARNLAEIYNQCLAVFYLQSLPKNFNVTRVLRWYRKDGDTLIGEQVLNLELRWLQKLFGESRDSLMIECYPVSHRQAKRLSKKMECLLNLDSCDYFLEGFVD